MPFATQFKPVSRQYGAQNGKQKLKFRKNCVENVVSDWAKNDLNIHNISFPFVTHYFIFIIFFLRFFVFMYKDSLFFLPI